jgi:FMN reductase
MIQMIERVHIVGLGGTLRKGSTSLVALQRSLEAAERAGATTEILDLNELRLPMYEPDTALEEYGPNVRRLIEAVRRADGMIWSTAAYHGSLAGATKNAIDFFQFLSGGDRPYLDGRVVGLIATAGGDQAAINTINTMINSVHSLRGTVVPLSVPIHNARRVFQAGELVDQRTIERLDQLGKLVAETAEKFHPREIALGA